MTTPLATSPSPSTKVDTTSSSAPNTDTSAFKSKKSGTKKKGSRRPRRRGADSDSDEEEDEAGQSDDSVSSASADTESEDDSEDEEAEEDVPSTSSKPVKGVFADVTSTTPPAWKDENAPTEEIGFDAFNRGESGLSIRGSAKRGRGRGGAIVGDRGEVKERKPLTEEQQKRLEEKRARQKEKLKVKRKEAKELKKKQREDKGGALKTEDAEPVASTSQVRIPEAKVQPEKKAKAKGKKKDAVAALAEDTAALSLDSPAEAPTSDAAAAGPAASHSAPDESTRRPPTGPKNGRAPRSDDPKVTPRSGGFWTHDQRSEGFYGGPGGRGSFRGGRGFDRGAFRGGFRGRGRPFVSTYGGSAAQSTGRGQELTETTEEDTGKGKTLEMDKIEAALEKQKEAALERQLEAEKQKEAEAAAKVDETATEAPQADQKPVPVRPVRESKWGHEGFESMQAVAHFQANRMLRGRGRGRGFFGGARGGFVPRPPFHNLPTPEKTPDAPGAKLPATAPAAPVAAIKPAESTESSSTAPGAESLLENQAVTVKLPGSEATVTSSEQTPQYNSISRPSSSSAKSSTIRATAPEFVQPKPVAAPAASAISSENVSSPQILAAPGSENGSISSNGHIAQQLPPGVAISPSGEYYHIANGIPDSRPIAQQRPPAFYPNQQRFTPQAQPYYPQSYSPDIYNQSRHPSFSGSGYIDARSVSPYPYAPQQAMNGGGAYFVPPRSSKVSIKAPSAEPNGDDGLKRYPMIDQAGNPMVGMEGMAGQQQYYSGHYNPYAMNGGGINYNAGWTGGEYANDGGSWGYGY